MERTSFSLKKDELDEINSRLQYGDNRSAWIRDAIRMKLAVLKEIDEVDDMTDEERREFVVEAVREAADNE